MYTKRQNKKERKKKQKKTHKSSHDLITIRTKLISSRLNSSISKSNRNIIN